MVEGKREEKSGDSESEDGSNCNTNTSLDNPKVVDEDLAPDSIGCSVFSA